MINFLFGKGKGKSRDDVIAESAKVDEEDLDEKEKDEGVETGNAKLDMEITKIKGQLDALNEVRKANSERFSRISEQMGEMRGMISDLSKTIGKIEVGATKAIDLVDSVQPEKLMINVKKQDAKVEATKAHLESTEARLKDLMDQVKKMREHMSVYKGLEQVQNMNEEMKDELAEMRKMQVNIEKHADRVETMFLEVSKKFAEFDKFNDTVKDMKRQFDKMTNDMEKFKVKLEEKAGKKEFVNLMDRFQDFQKHTDNVLKLLDERSKNVKEDLFNEFNKIKTVLEHKYEIPDIDEAAKKLEDKQEEKKGMMDKVKDKITGGEEEEKKEGEKEDKQIVDKGLDEEGKKEEESKQPADAGEGGEKEEEKDEASEEAKKEGAEQAEQAG